MLWRKYAAKKCFSLWKTYFCFKKKFRIVESVTRPLWNGRQSSILGRKGYVSLCRHDQTKCRYHPVSSRAEAARPWTWHQPHNIHTLILPFVAWCLDKGVNLALPCIKLSLFHLYEPQGKIMRKNNKLWRVWSSQWNSSSESHFLQSDTLQSIAEDRAWSEHETGSNKKI